MARALALPDDPTRNSEIVVGVQGSDPMRARALSEVSGSTIDQLGGMLAEVLGTQTPGLNQSGLTVRQQVESLKHWVYVCVVRIREAVSKNPRRLLEMATDGDTEEIFDPNHDFNRLLTNPNPWDTDIEFWQQTMTYLELTGNAIWLLVRDGLGIAEMWVIPSQWIKPKHTSKEPLVGYEMDIGSGAKPIPIPIEDIVHIRYPNPMDRFWGLGTLSAAVQAMKSVDRIKASQLAAFNNEILSSLYFYTEGEMSQPAYERLREVIQSRYAGPENARLPMLLEEATKIGQLNHKPAEMDYPGSSKLTRDEILAIFGVPPILASEIGTANRANSESQIRIFQEFTVLPRLCLIQARVNKELIPEFGDNLRFEFENPVPLDKLVSQKQRNEGVKGDYMLANEARDELGLESQEWGEQPRWVYDFVAKHKMTPSKMFEEAEAGRLMAEPEPETAPVPGEVPPGLEEAAGADADEVSTPNAPNAGEPEAPTRAAQVGADARTFDVRQDESEEDDDEEPLPDLKPGTTFFKTVRNDQDELTRLSIRTLRRYFASQEKRILTNIDRVLGPLIGEPREVQQGRIYLARETIYAIDWNNSRLYPDGSVAQVRLVEGEPSEIIGWDQPPDCLASYSLTSTAAAVRQVDPGLMDNLEEWERAADELTARMEARLKLALEKGWNTQMTNLGLQVRFDIRNEQAEQWIAQKDRSYWDGTINETTRHQLGERLAADMAAGPTIKKLKDSVRDVMGSRIRSSAETIARTETNGAYNGGKDIARTEQGLSVKSWIATFDARTRSPHHSANGQEVAQTEVFIVAEERLKYPGDPNGSVFNIANCRCTAEAVVQATDEPLPPGAQLAPPEGSGKAGAPEKELVLEDSTIPDHMTVSNKQFDPSNPDQLLGNEIRRQVIGGLTDEEHTRRVGRQIRKHVEARHTESKVAVDALRLELAEAEAESARVLKALSKESTVAEIEAVDQGTVIRQRLEHSLRLAENERATALANDYRKVLGDVRDMGSESSGFKWAPRSPKAELQGYHERTKRLYPKDWLRTAVDDQPMKGGFVRKSDGPVGGFYSPHPTVGSEQLRVLSMKDIAQVFQREARRHRQSTYTHELFHRMEHKVDGITKLEGEFFARRTKDESTRQLRGYHRGNLGKSDKFCDAYTGKQYFSTSSQFTEIGSTGMEQLFHPDKRASGCRPLSDVDPDHTDFILGLLAGL